MLKFKIPKLNPIKNLKNFFENLVEIEESEGEKYIAQPTFKEYFESLKKNDPAIAIKFAEDYAGEPYPTVGKQLLNDFTKFFYVTGKITLIVTIISIAVSIAMAITTAKVVDSMSKTE